MHRILKITAALILTALPAGAALGQSNQRNDGSQNQQDGGYGRRRDRNSNGSGDSSGYGGGNRQNRDFSNRESGGSNSSGFSNRDNGSLGGGNSGSSFRNRDSGSSDSGSRDSSFGTPRSSSSSSTSFTPKASSADQLAPAKSSGTFIAKDLPPELAVLTSRSIFSKDHRAVAAANESKPKASVFVSDIQKLIFRGAMKENDHFVAFIEDSGTSRPPQWVAIGQTLTANGGQINDITLDHIIVEKSGTVRQIGVGDNLDSGTRLPSPPSTASTGVGASLANPNSSVGGTANTHPAGATASATPAVTASTTGTASDEDVAEMMRQRRARELGQ